MLEAAYRELHRLGCRPVDGLEAECFKPDGFDYCRNQECVERRATLAATDALVAAVREWATNPNSDDGVLIDALAAYDVAIAEQRA